MNNMQSNNIVISEQTNVGFTLAEVLITLVIIGVIASLTIPAMLQNIQDAQYKTAYKQAIADANQALLMTKNNYNMPSFCESYVGQNVQNGFNSINFAYFKNAFSVALDCSSDYRNCWSDDERYSGGADPQVGGSSNCPAFMDSKGRSWLLWDGNCFCIYVDVNGKKEPNQMGRDRFRFCISSLSDESSSKINIPGDIINQDDSSCPQGNCYFTSWLKQ
jgi:prepilin-type N-terminal cleavage/methylation domain-containing protein